MPRFLTDENFTRTVTRQLQTRNPDWDIVRVQDAGLAGSSDSNILEWATAESRIVLTHDARTMSPLAYDRIGDGVGMPGVILVPDSIDIGAIVEQVELAVGATFEGEWEGFIVRLPL